VIWRAIHFAFGFGVTLIQARFSARQPDDDEDIEQVEANGWNNEQVHGGDIRCMVAQEGAPP
jgi:hypothetical protein